MSGGREWRDRSRRSSGNDPPELQQSPAGQHGGSVRHGHRQDSRREEWRPRASSSSSLAPPATLPTELQTTSSSQARSAMQPASHPSSSSPAHPPPQRALQPSSQDSCRQEWRRRASSSLLARLESLPTELHPSSSSSPARPASHRAFQPTSHDSRQQEWRPRASSTPSQPASLSTELQASYSSQASPALQPSSSSKSLSTLQLKTQPPTPPAARRTFEHLASWPVTHLDPQAGCYNPWPQYPPSSLQDPSWLAVFLPYPPSDLLPESLDPLYLQQLYYQLHQKNPQQLYYLLPFLLSSGQANPLVPPLWMNDPSAQVTQTQYLPSVPAIIAPPIDNLQDEMQQQVMRNEALERYWAAYDCAMATNSEEYPIQELNTDGTEEPPETDAAPIKNGSESAPSQQ